MASNPRKKRRTAGRPPLGEQTMAMVHLRLEPDDLAQVRAAADAAGISVSEWMREAVRQALAREAPQSGR